MKSIKTVLILALVIISSFPSLKLAQEKNDLDSLKSVLVKLFELSKSKNYASGSFIIVYDGEDLTRRGKESFNYSNPKEKNQVERTCKKIKAFLDLSDSYEFGVMRKVKKNESESFVLPVIFKSGGITLNTSFSFLKIEGKFLLAEIE